jgi:TatA/E family protein of Tat protein translocase
MNFMGIGPMELVFILIFALIIFGPRRLPELASQAGRALREFRQATNDLTKDFRDLNLEELTNPFAPDKPVKTGPGGQPAAVHPAAPVAVTAPAVSLQTPENLASTPADVEVDAAVVDLLVEDNQAPSERQVVSDPAVTVVSAPTPTPQPVQSARLDDETAPALTVIEDPVSAVDPTEPCRDDDTEDTYADLPALAEDSQPAGKTTDEVDATGSEELAAGMGPTAEHVATDAETVGESVTAIEANGQTVDVPASGSPTHEVDLSAQHDSDQAHKGEVI